MLAGLFLPIGFYDEDYAFWSQFPSAAGPVIVGMIGLMAGELWLKRLRNGRSWAALGPIALLLSAAGPVMLPTAELQMGFKAPGFWLVLVGVALFAWVVMAHLAAMPRDRWRNVLVPALFGLLFVFLWQAVVVGFAIPAVLLPTPTAIVSAISREAPTLTDDFRQTFLKAVLAGYVIGNLASAVPIVGIAPIMVMWFGFGWESKTAVIVFMIFFPMLINALAGLNAADRMSLDLMRSYGASYRQTLLKLRLPMALPFLFNALKINSTLALIGAIVAEFFGSPTAGMGFRISVEAARMNLDVVWATIAVAAVAGSAFYGILALLERAFTFWHPSYRTRN
jgi:NitT/TauT family transport system permease protein